MSVPYQRKLKRIERARIKPFDLSYNIQHSCPALLCLGFLSLDSQSNKVHQRLTQADRLSEIQIAHPSEELLILHMLRDRRLSVFKRSLGDAAFFKMRFTDGRNASQYIRIECIAKLIKSGAAVIGILSVCGFVVFRDLCLGIGASVPKRL